VERRSRTQWARLRRLRDRQIDYSDIPATTPEFWAPALVVHPSRKVPVSLRLDEHVLTWFKSHGARYQTRINAVLRAYVERHAAGRPGVKEPIATYKDSLRADLEAARERYEALENLRSTIGPRIFDYVERRIEALGERSDLLKLPVLFFFLVRRDPRELRRFDEFLGRLRRSHRKRELPNLLDRLRSEEDYRQAVSAIFEIEVLRTLLDAAPAGHVLLYPRIDKTAKHADAAIRLGGKTVYVEAKLVSQNAKQERIQDIGHASALGHPAPSRADMDELGLTTVSRGVVVHSGDPSGDVLRVSRKLTEKPVQRHPDAPNIVCLGLADSWPDMVNVETGIEAVFSGSTQADPRVTGVLVFEVRGGQIVPLRAFQNRIPHPPNALEGREWRALATLFGFPAEGARSA
jgi:uncharacterized protein (DUF4415 family)